MHFNLQIYFVFSVVLMGIYVIELNVVIYNAIEKIYLLRNTFTNNGTFVDY